MISKLIMTLMLLLPCVFLSHVSAKQAEKGQVTQKSPLPQARAGMCRFESGKPCVNLALIVIYEEKEKRVVNIVRVQKNGHFEIKVPQYATWTLSSVSKDWVSDLSFVTSQAGVPELLVILKKAKK
jgi:hypothetical protein